MFFSKFACSSVAAVTVIVLNTYECFAVTMTTKSLPILKYSDDIEAFDAGCVANPVILPPSKYCSEWQCYYYGNDGTWNGGRKSFMPTGASGLATSENGLTWTKVPGQELGGAILRPSDVGSGSWDSVQTGVGDVIRINEKELHMYYFGGSEEGIAIEAGPPGSLVGFRMRIGRAKSKDNGRSWVKDDSFLLDYDESEGLFASWPRIVTFEDNRPWEMYYHSFTGTKWRAFVAESTDNGDTWVRKGLVLEGDGESEDAFDFAGVGTRSICRWRNGLLMIYEGVDKKGTHSIGAAFRDLQITTSKEWTKLNNGKPILQPGKGPLGDWANECVGTPFVVNMPDGSLRIYHCGSGGPDGKMCVGVVESKSGDIGPECWRACG